MSEYDAADDSRRSYDVAIAALREALPAIKLSKLPVPPSLNNSFYNNSEGGRSKSSIYKAWRTACGWNIRQQNPPRIRGPVEVAIRIEDGGTRADLDNLAKGPIDLLCALQLIDGDTSKTLRKVSLEWASVEGMEIEVRRAS